ncbi:hypothetical protein ACHHYP_10534 [Achlya hypogyna]|uniref:Uncharacterized protein n=1 Tax=Achlya hypogyna TaxID=1202772 RepID=A0A1V9YL64_ACHHY|nr:hypothetical protein ACHHYP_10534 [Achlya hypogyna]
MATVAALWGEAVDCVTRSLAHRIGAARQLLDTHSNDAPLRQLLSAGTSRHLRSLLTTASEVLETDDEASVSTWYFFLATAARYMEPATRLEDENAVLRLLRRLGPFMTLLPVALAAVWLVPPSDATRAYEALEASPAGREYIWEGIVRAFNQCGNLPAPDVAALGAVMGGLLGRDSALVYLNDFRVCLDIVLREATDLDLDDPRRAAVALVFERCVASSLYLESDRYRGADLLAAVVQWYDAVVKVDATTPVAPVTLLHIRVLLS